MQKLYSILFLCALWSICITGKSQLPVQFSQIFKTVDFVNPAYSVIENSFSAKILYRNQWNGLKGSPEVYGFTSFLPIERYNMGVGIQGVNVKRGNFSISNVSSNINIDLQVSNSNYLGFGLQFGVEYNYIDKDKIITYKSLYPESNYGSNYDFANSFYSFVNPCAGLGFLYYNTKFYTGVSSYLMINGNRYTEVDFYQGTYAIAGTIQRLNQAWRIKESMQARFLPGNIRTYEAGINFLYNDEVWFGVSNRINESVIMSCDVKIGPVSRLAFSYEAQLTELKRFTYGSFEMRLDFRFGDGKHNDERKQKMIYLLN